ncbi:MAG: SPASM domain-containing protein, partial [Synergistaceae bacterium]|nr:SPASM domain-containing protein [Synergistaceae bacterium]
LQTNGTLLDDEFCAFFRENHFLIGVSVDGPPDCHNAYRGDAEGGGSFGRTMRGIELLKKHGVPFNTLTAVHDVNARKPVEVYRFLRELTDTIQFLPVVERLPTPYEAEEGQSLAVPPGIHFAGVDNRIASFSVPPGAWGDFLCAVLDEWKKKDEGRKHVQLIDVALGNLRGVPSSLCVHNPLCGHSGCVEANGDVYACDRYAFPSYCLGNLMETDMRVLMERNRRFGMHKAYGLPEECFDCPYLKLCFGGCPKDRIFDGKNYLCEGYKRFFDAITRLVRNGIHSGQELIFACGSTENLSQFLKPVVIDRFMPILL